MTQETVDEKTIERRSEHTTKRAKKMRGNMDGRWVRGLVVQVALFLVFQLGSTRGRSVVKSRQVMDARNFTIVDPAITDPKALKADRVKWYTQDPNQQDHIRLHCYLSMASYGDYRTLCPGTFAVDGNEFEVLEEFDTTIGQKGFVARVPFMQKIVIVFRGYEGDAGVSWEAVPIDFGRPVAGCTAATNCTTGRGVLDLYNSARVATNDWAVAKAAVNATGLKFSVTGHALGGSVAQLAALDLGIDGFVHYAHSQAAPRSVSPTAARILAQIFQGESGQHVVANNDYFAHQVPRSPDFTRVNTAVWIFGNRTEWMINCHFYPENLACLGDGSSIVDHSYYFTPLGQCGAPDKGF